MWFEHTIVSLLNRLESPRREAPSGLVLGREREGTQSIIWPHNQRAQHLCVLGKTGVGKTHFLEWLAVQLMRRGDPIVFFDYHGDATNHLVALAATCESVASRLVVIDPTDSELSPGLNPLELDSLDEGVAFGRSSELAAILRQRWHVDSFGARTEELLRNTLFVLSATGQTLVEAPLLLTSRPFRDQLLSRVTEPDILDYWHERYEPLSEAMKGTFREPLLNKITGFLTEPACRHFLGQSSTFTFRRAIDAGCWVLINLAKGRLREHAHTLGNLIFARLQFEVLARTALSETGRRLFTVFADEVQNLAENDLATLLTEGRKFRISLVTGNQSFEQLTQSVRTGLLSAGAHVFFQLSAQDAGVLAGELSVAQRHRYHHELASLPRGHALTRLGAADPRGIVVPPLPRFGPAADVTGLRARSQRMYGRPRIEIEAEIRARRAQFRSLAPPHRTEHAHVEDEGQQGW